MPPALASSPSRFEPPRGSRNHPPLGPGDRGCTIRVRPVHRAAAGFEVPFSSFARMSGHPRHLTTGWFFLRTSSRCHRPREGTCP